ncbi:MAG: hypothetical protein IJ990_04015, partial [Alistipes sp.]|nr:hypothetical protein [Alistipes sp.]
IHDWMPFVFSGGFGGRFPALCSPSQSSHTEVCCGCSAVASLENPTPKPPEKIKDGGCFSALCSSSQSSHTERMLWLLGRRKP